MLPQHLEYRGYKIRIMRSDTGWHIQALPRSPPEPYLQRSLSRSMLSQKRTPSGSYKTRWTASGHLNLPWRRNDAVKHAFCLPAGVGGYLKSSPTAFGRVAAKATRAK